MKTRTLATLFVLALLAATVPAHAQPVAEARPGKLVIAGGGVTTSSREMWQFMLAQRLAGRPLGIISTASGNPASSGEPLAASLVKEHGAGAALFIPLDSKLGNADAPEILALIRRCGGFFFTGGGQTLTTLALLKPDGSPTPALAVIREIHRAGGVIGGSSAGAAIMSDPMITGGISRDALLHGATPADARRGAKGVTFGPGLGFSPGILYCQHHLERGRLGRLLVALTSEKVGLRIGIGVSEDTAVVVDHAADRAWVIGARDVVHLEATGAQRTADGRIVGVRLNFLTRGDRIRLSTGEIEPASGKTAVPSGPERVSLEIADAWAREALRPLLIQLAQGSATARAVARDPRFELVFLRTENSRAWTTPSNAAPKQWTLTGVSVEVRPL